MVTVDIFFGTKNDAMDNLPSSVFVFVFVFVFVEIVLIFFDSASVFKAIDKFVSDLDSAGLKNDAIELFCGALLIGSVGSWNFLSRECVSVELDDDDDGMMGIGFGFVALSKKRSSLCSFKHLLYLFKSMEISHYII